MGTTKFWSTDGFTGAKALSVWIDAVTEATQVSMDINSADAAAFSATFSQKHLGKLTLNTVRAQQAEVQRSSSQGAPAPSDQIYLLYVRSGHFTLIQNTHQCIGNAGDSAILDMRTAFKLITSHDFDSMTVAVNIDWLGQFLPDPEQYVARTLKGSTSWGQPLSHTMATIAESNEFPGFEAMLAEHWATGVALATGSMAESTPQMTSYRSSLHRRLRATLRERCNEVQLNPAIVATENGISRRTLHEIFALAGTTFGQELLKLRLAKAKRLLTEKRFENLSIAEIAWRCGFDDPSYFSRVFHRATGARPSSYRRVVLFQSP